MNANHPNLNTPLLESGKSKPQSFLKSVAQAYASRYDEMSEFCFLFPNKRSGTFFLKHLSESLDDKPMLAPEVLGVEEFVTRIADREPASRIDMLFRLYNIYCNLAGKSGALASESDLLDFDRFAPWGETVLGDFDEVERYDVDAAEIFKNVRDYREISSNFLTDEQRAVIERYFGYSPASADVAGFWKCVNEPEEGSPLKEKFVELWKLLPELYSALLDDLESDGLCMPGSAFRIALRRMEAGHNATMPWKRIVVVGFNMLSATESKLFGELQKLTADDDEPYAEFFWDATGPVLNAESGIAAATMKRNRRNFPEPEWAREYMQHSDVSEMPPRINVAASPSNATQVKIAAEIVKDWIQEIGQDAIRDARAAVVIPDENLLMPLLHSLPRELESVNLTMGYSMRYTSIASFIYHLRRLQMRRRKSGTDVAYYHADLKLFLAHPLLHVVAGSEAVNELNGYVSQHHKITVTLEEIRNYSEKIAEMLRPISREASVKDTIAYIDHVLLMLDVALSDGVDMPAINSKMERSQIFLYRTALSRLESSVHRHGISMNFISVFHLVDKLLAGEKITFEGEPLEGLQVMGLLETRALDFDHVIVLSMNDKIMPRRSRKRTFIPDALRRGYGLPTMMAGEEQYAYYFYRLMSRASDVNLIYDARAGEGMRSGGKSRFLLQLDMLHARGLTDLKSYSFTLNPSLSTPRDVEKTPVVMARLEEYLKVENGRNLSASALMNYCQCQVKFYYRNVLGINDDSEPSDYIDAITQGNIVHEVMQRIYVPGKLQRKYLKDKIVITSECIEGLLEDAEHLDRLVRMAVNHQHFHKKDWNDDSPLPATASIVADRLRRQVEDVLRHDLALAPFELAGVEVKGNVQWSAGNSRKVNMSYSFDRVDVVDGHFRVVDYKTGSSHVEAAEFENVFNGDSKAKYIIQLMLYAHLLEERVREEENRETGDIGMAIYDVNSISKDGEVLPKIAKKHVTGHKQISEAFIAEMERIIEDIFDAEKPFRVAENEDACTYCSLRQLCGKE